jgi:hypothetical protein
MVDVGKASPLVLRPGSPSALHQHASNTRFTRSAGIITSLSHFKAPHAVFDDVDKLRVPLTGCKCILTKSLPRPALAKHRQYMWGTLIPLSAFYLSQVCSVSHAFLLHTTSSHHIIPWRVSRLRKKKRGPASGSPSSTNLIRRHARSLPGRPP